MKQLLAALAALLLLGGCKKAKEDLQEAAALKLLDGTEWKITLFKNGASDITTDFADYVFRFNKDLTVQALRNSSTVATGTYKGNIAGHTIYANFPPSAHAPLPQLNATWTITESTMQSLTAKVESAQENKALKMVKQ